MGVHAALSLPLFCAYCGSASVATVVSWQCRENKRLHILVLALISSLMNKQSRLGFKFAPALRRMYGLCSLSLAKKKKNISPAYEPTLLRRMSLSAAVLHIVNCGVHLTVVGENKLTDNTAAYDQMLVDSQFSKLESDGLGAAANDVKRDKQSDAPTTCHNDIMVWQLGLLSTRGRLAMLTSRGLVLVSPLEP